MGVIYFVEKPLVTVTMIKGHADKFDLAYK